VRVRKHLQRIFTANKAYSPKTADESSIPSSSVSKLEASPVQASKHTQRIIRIANLSHFLHILQREPSKGVLVFARITHVDKFRRQIQRLVLGMPVVEQFTGPVSYSEIVGGISPAGGELPYCDFVLVYSLWLV